MLLNPLVHSTNISDSPAVPGAGDTYVKKTGRKCMPCGVRILIREDYKLKISCSRRWEDEGKGLLKGRLTSLGSESPHIGCLCIWPWSPTVLPSLAWHTLSFPAPQHESHLPITWVLSLCSGDKPCVCWKLSICALTAVAVGAAPRASPGLPLWFWAVTQPRHHKLSFQPHVFLAHLLLLPPNPFRLSHAHTASGAESLLLILICKFTFSMGRISSGVSKVKPYLTWQKKRFGLLGQRERAQLGNLDKNSCRK